MLRTVSSAQGRSRFRVGRFATLLLCGAVMLSVVPGCEKDPHNPDTWIDKLDEAQHLDEAVRNLERLKDPKAIAPLAEVWRKYNRPSRILRAVINIASGDVAKKLPTTWGPAVPMLVEAVESFDATNDRSIDDAVVALDALGQAKDKSTLQAIITAAQKPLPRLSPANRVRIAAVRALGSFPEDRSVDVLIKILSGDPEKQLVRLNAAAALSLAETGSVKALPELKRALFIGPIYNQVRTAVTRVGKEAEPLLLAMLKGDDKDIQKLAKEQNFAQVAPGTVEFKSALLLGDLRSTKAVPLLTAGLGKPSVTSYFDERTKAPGPPTHMAYLQALQSIGDPSTEGALYDYATAGGTDDDIRPRAIDVYSWLAKDDRLLPKLLENIKNEQEEDNVRFVSILAYGRIARKAADIAPIDTMMKDYDARAKKAADKSAAAFKAKKQDERQAADSEKVNAERWRDALGESKARIEIAVQCKADPACYGAALTAPDVSPGKLGLPKAERALIELYRMGAKGEPATDALLAQAGSPERFVREGIHLALPRIAKLPCTKCAERLNQILEEQRNQTTMDALNAETRIVYHYFLWAGK